MPWTVRRDRSTSTCRSATRSSGRAGPLPPGRADGGPWHRPVVRTDALPIESLAALAAAPGARGVIVAGGGIGDAEGVQELSRALGWPVLADPRSGARVPAAYTVSHFDEILRVRCPGRSPPPRDRAAAGFAAGVEGAGPVAGRARRLAGRHRGGRHPLRPRSRPRRSDRGTSRRGRGRAGPITGRRPGHPDGTPTVMTTMRKTTRTSGSRSRSTASWPRVERGVGRTVGPRRRRRGRGHRHRAGRPRRADRAGGGPRRGAGAPRRCCAGRVVVDADPRRRVVRRADPGLQVLANRGANGIDGVVSTAVGVALARRQAGLPSPTRPPCSSATWPSCTTPTGCSGRPGGASTSPSSWSTTTAAASSRSCLRPARSTGPRFEQLFGTPHGVDLPGADRRPRHQLPDHRAPARRGPGGGRGHQGGRGARDPGAHRPPGQRGRPRRDPRRCRRRPLLTRPGPVGLIRAGRWR